VALDIPLPTLAETPNYCGFGITYEIVLQGTETLPPFMAIVEAENKLQVLSSDPANRGTYTVDLRITPAGPTSVGTQIVSYTFTISACRIDTVSFTTAIADFTYTINSGAVFKSGDFSNLYVECGVTYTLVEQGQPDYTAAIFSETTDPSVGVITQSTDRLLDKVTKTLVLTATCDESGDTSV